jgi:parallel beta-helix repeat protein
VANLLTKCVTNNPAVDCPNAGTLNFALLSAAVAGGGVIGVFNPIVDTVVLPAAVDVRIEECHDAEITAADPSKDVIDIPPAAGDGDPTNNVHPTTKDILINGLSVIGGQCGIRVRNNSTEIKAVRAEKNNIGFCIEGSNNILNGSNGDESLTTGVLVSGNNNTVRNSKALSNVSDGFSIGGNGNSVRANTAELNGEAGFFVPGNGNNLQDNKANKNFDGFEITGQSNILQRNRAERNLDDGFEVTGTGNRLGTNTANNNSGDEFNIAANNVDLGGNKANGVACTFPGGAAQVCP